MSFSKKYYYKETFTKEIAFKETYIAIEFEDCKFSGCSFIECKFQKCKFIESSFLDCVLSAVNPLESCFRDVQFSKSKVIGIDWTKATELSDLVLSDCQINYSNFSMLKIPKIRIACCEAKDVDFTETDLSRGDFQKTDFENSRFFKTNLSQANFKGAINYNIDIKNNLIKNTRFSLPEALSLLNSLDIIID
jgi:fluoroquinolone resistance protein